MLEQLRWKKYPVLNDGFICLVDVMGDDSAIVQAARVSYGKDEKKNTGTEGYAEALTKYYGSKVSDIKINYEKGHTTIVFESDLVQNIVLYHESENKIERDKLQEICRQGMKDYHNRDRSLIRRLMKDSHTSPFEMVEFKFKVRVPMDCWRQWIRHRTANVNEYSTRYSEAIDSRQTTSPEEWRLQAKDNKQGSSGFLEEWPKNFRVEHKEGENFRVYAPDDPMHCPIVNQSNPITPGEYLSNSELVGHDASDWYYQLLLSIGIAREQARKDLPLSTYTEAYWKCDLHNIFNFLRLRLDSHAQLEIRLYAQAMYEIVKQVCPIACEAFEDYVLNSVKFSAMEMELIREVINSMKIPDVNDGQFFVDEHKPDSMTDNEWKKFLEKIS